MYFAITLSSYYARIRLFRGSRKKKMKKIGAGYVDSPSACVGARVRV